MKLLGLTEVGMRSKNNNTFDLHMEIGRVSVVDEAVAINFLRDINCFGIIIPVLYNEKKYKYFHEIINFISILNNPTKVKEKVLEYLKDNTEKGIDPHIMFICEEIITITCSGMMVVFSEDQD